MEPIQATCLLRAFTFLAHTGGERRFRFILFGFAEGSEPFTTIAAPSRGELFHGETFSGFA